MTELSTILASGDILDYKKGGTSSDNDLLNKAEIEALRPEPVTFLTTSNQSIPISTNQSSASFFPLDTFAGTGAVLADAATGAVQNTSGRTISSLSGTVNFQPDKSGGGTAIFYLVSERSPDGVTWTPNSNSLRVFEVNSSSETFSTKLSLLLNWVDGEWVRFKAYTAGGGSITLEPPSQTIDGDLYTGPSFVWTLIETE